MKKQGCKKGGLKVPGGNPHDTLTRTILNSKGGKQAQECHTNQSCHVIAKKNSPAWVHSTNKRETGVFGG